MVSQLVKHERIETTVAKVFLSLISTPPMTFCLSFWDPHLLPNWICLFQVMKFICIRNFHFQLSLFGSYCILVYSVIFGFFINQWNGFYPKKKERKKLKFSLYHNGYYFFFKGKVICGFVTLFMRYVWRLDVLYCLNWAYILIFFPYDPNLEFWLVRYMYVISFPLVCIFSVLSKFNT